MNCKICNKDLHTAGYFCPEHIPVYFIHENMGYKSK